MSPTMDRMRAPDEPARYFDRSDMDHLNHLVQCAVDITLPFDTHLICRHNFQEDDHQVPARLLFTIFPLKDASHVISQDWVDRQTTLAHTIFEVFPLRVFKGTTACGRRISKPFLRDSAQSSHDYIEAMTVARDVFGTSSAIFNICLAPR